MRARQTKDESAQGWFHNKIYNEGTRATFLWVIIVDIALFNGKIFDEIIRVLLIAFYGSNEQN